MLMSYLAIDYDPDSVSIIQQDIFRNCMKTPQYSQSSPLSVQVSIPQEVVQATWLLQLEATWKMHLSKAKSNFLPITSET